MRRNGTLTYLHGDHLGSTSLATDASGNEIDGSRTGYYPFGERRYGAAVTDYGFTGQREEAGFGLYDYNARYYDAYLNRFVSADAVVPNPGNPQDYNRYAYVVNSPLVYVDPSGHYYGDLATYCHNNPGDPVCGATVAPHTDPVYGLPSDCIPRPWDDPLTASLRNAYMLAYGAGEVEYYGWSFEWFTLSYLRARADLVQAGNKHPIESQIAERMWFWLEGRNAQGAEALSLSFHLDPGMASGCLGPSGSATILAYAMAFGVNLSNYWGIGQYGPDLFNSRGQSMTYWPHTGRFKPANLREFYALQAARADPGAGIRVESVTMGDPRWPAEDGWEKWYQLFDDIRVDYAYNPATGQAEDFKFK
jgi:RHS repeat-associated protein